MIAADVDKIKALGLTPEEFIAKIKGRTFEDVNKEYPWTHWIDDGTEPKICCVTKEETI